MAFALPDLGIDALYPESSLLATSGARARRSVDRPDAPSAARVTASGGSRGGRQLRARDGTAGGARRTCRRPSDRRIWAAAVVELWAGADDFLQPLVARMRRLSTNAAS